MIDRLVVDVCSKHTPNMDASKLSSRDSLFWTFRRILFRTVACDGYKGYDAFHTARCNWHPMHRISEMLDANIGVRRQLELRFVLPKRQATTLT